MARRKAAKAPARKKKTPARKRKASKPRAQRPPKEVTRDRFLVWRAPRVGRRNPDNLTNPVWAWGVTRGHSAYEANALFDGPSSFEVGPCWCASRFGQSRTELPDGRIVAIGGEHEDYYDPDFFIYNDVIVTHPSGAVHIYGYPTDVFGPTDFHSATVVGDRIVLIGALGYVGQRVVGTTPVCVLDTSSYAISRRETSGALPGWIWEHGATLTEDGSAIVVSGGHREMLVGDEYATVENLDDWSLDLQRWSWTRLTERPWQEWSLRRADRRPNDLFEIESLRFSRDYAKTSSDRRELAKRVRQRGGLPDFALFDARYSPPIEHEAVAGSDDYPIVARVVVDGVMVRYTEDSIDVRIVIEGLLPEASVETIVEDVRSKLERLERTPYERRRLQ